MLVSFILRIFNWYVLVLAIGNFYWHRLISVKTLRGAEAVYIVNIVIAVAVLVFHTLLPKHIEEKFLEKVANKKLYSHSYSYYYRCKMFKKFYDKENPATGFLNSANE